MSSSETKQIITSYMGTGLSRTFEQVPSDLFECMQEIRIRVNRPLIVIINGKEYFLKPDGSFTGLQSGISEAYTPVLSDINKILELISNFSIYAFEEELRNGYITISGGHRVGITGRAVVERGAIKTIKNINGLNFRLSHEMKGCADGIINKIIDEHKAVRHTMIISPPCCGKSTLLRDIIRQISTGSQGFSGQSVGLVDERSEIAGCYMGKPQNDVGIRTDVLDACPKAEGMIMLLRSMSPKVIAVDEIGKPADVYAIDSIINAGIKLICTAHGRSLEELRRKPQLSELVDKRIFELYIVLESPGRIYGVYDSNYEILE